MKRLPDRRKNVHDRDPGNLLSTLSLDGWDLPDIANDAGRKARCYGLRIGR